jgi:hypothetical protein
MIKNNLIFRFWVDFESLAEQKLALLCTCIVDYKNTYFLADTKKTIYLLWVAVAVLQSKYIFGSESTAK